MKKVVYLIVLVMVCSVVLATEEDLKNHIDVKNRELRDELKRDVGEKVDIVVVDIKGYVDSQLGSVKEDLRSALFVAVRRVVFGVFGSVILAFFVSHLVLLMIRKRKGWVSQPGVKSDVKPVEENAPEYKGEKVGTIEDDLGGG